MLKQYPDRTCKSKVNLFRLCGREKNSTIGEKSNYFMFMILSEINEFEMLKKKKKVSKVNSQDSYFKYAW